MLIDFICSESFKGNKPLKEKIKLASIHWKALPSNEKAKYRQMAKTDQMNPQLTDRQQGRAVIKHMSVIQREVKVKVLAIVIIYQL
jgi:hypothetical protein